MATSIALSPTQLIPVQNAKPGSINLEQSDRASSLSTRRLSGSSGEIFGNGQKSIRAMTSSQGPLRGDRQVGGLAVSCAASQPDLAEQMKLMAVAEKRWASQVAEGKVKSLSAKEAGYAVQLNDHVLLDVRPAYEQKKAWVKNAIWVPAFDADKGWAPGTIVNKFSTFLLGGWWSGAPLTKRNERFMPDVVAKIPKSANVIVACQKGLRSLAACEQLYKAGYRNIFWLNGGFDTAEEGDFEREGPESLKFAGIGGMSEFLGWTDVQRAQAAKEGITYRLKLFGRLAAVVVGADVLFVTVPKIIEALHPN